MHFLRECNNVWQLATCEEVSRCSIISMLHCTWLAAKCHSDVTTISTNNRTTLRQTCPAYKCLISHLHKESEGGWDFFAKPQMIRAVMHPSIHQSAHQPWQGRHVWNVVHAHKRQEEAQLMLMGAHDTAPINNLSWDEAAMKSKLCVQVRVYNW